MTDADGSAPPRRASLADTLRILAIVLLPTFAKGVMRRRRSVVRFVARHDLDGRAVRELQRLRRKYGAAPLTLPLPGRPQTLVLDGADVRRVLEGAPRPFSPASREKRATLAHFEPHAVLITEPPLRAPRRRWNERALEPEQAIHSQHEALVARVSKDARALAAGSREHLDWPTFIAGWNRATRHALLGPAARDDTELTAWLASLRARANWSFFAPRRRAILRDLRARLAAYLDPPEAHSPAHVASDEVAGDDRVDQVTHWLFAAEAIGIASFRALAVLGAHPEHLASARLDARARAPDWPFLRACILDSLRLWPTTPVILREHMPDGTPTPGFPARRGQVIVFAPLFHRDDETMEDAHRFAPEAWVKAAARPRWPLVPFSGGPAMCPARHLAPMLGAAFIATLLREHDIALVDAPAGWTDGGPLPATLDHFELRLRLEARALEDAAAAS